VTLPRHGYDSPVNAIRPNADQLIENKSISLDSRTLAIGWALANCGEASQLYHAGSRPAYRMLGRTPEKKPGAFAPGGGNPKLARSCSERLKLA
jgi:hypothetical protein